VIFLEKCECKKPHEFLKNRRTLRRRVRRITSLCIAVTIFLFCGSITGFGIEYFRSVTSMLTDYFSTYVAQCMSTETFLDQMGIQNLWELEPDSPEFVQWVSDIKRNDWINSIRLAKPAMAGIEEYRTFDKYLGPADGDPAGPLNSEDSDDDFMKIPGYINSEDMFELTILVRSKPVYIDAGTTDGTAIGQLNGLVHNNLENTFLNHMLDALSSRSISEIVNKNGSTVATVSAGISKGYVMIIGLMFLSGIFISAVAALAAGLIISRLFTMPIAKPLWQLDEKIRCIAGDSIETAMTSNIELKRPLREIEMLADSTNSVLAKMREYNELLIAQNEELEAQNEELEQSKRQLEEAQTTIIQTENMASIGQLTAAITHEINTPLGAINSNAQLSGMMISGIFELESVKNDPELRGMLEQLKESNDISAMACSRVSQIIRSLKNFSKVDEAECQVTDINEGLKSVLVLTSNLWKRKIVIHEDYGDLPGIKCYAGMLNQVFMNLIVNAIQSIEDKGNIYIKTWTDEKYAYVSVKDDGCGIAGDNLDKIFNNGFTTKSNSHGMGLGLSISRSIMDKHRGNITVTSEPGKGSEFIVSLPL
jgi:signal transduction histidine kinase